MKNFTLTLLLVFVGNMALYAQFCGTRASSQSEATDRGLILGGGNALYGMGTNSYVYNSKIFLDYTTH